MKKLLSSWVLIAAVCLSNSAQAETLRCGTNLISRGDFAVEVLQKCGEPDFVDHWQQNANSRHAVANTEQWYYNFGSSQLIQILQFRDGKLERIDTAGYGFTAPGPRDCRPSEIVPGLSKYELLEVCGEPAQVSSFVALSSPQRTRNTFGQTPSLQSNYLVPVLRESWLYNFGRQRLLREVTLENGVVVEVDIEGRGFNSR